MGTPICEVLVKDLNKHILQYIQTLPSSHTQHKRKTCLPQGCDEHLSHKEPQDMWDKLQTHTHTHTHTHTEFGVQTIEAVLETLCYPTG